MSTMPSAQDHRLYHRLQLAAHRVRKAADRAIGATVELSTAQAAVLTIIQAEGRASQNTVAERLSLHESAMTTMVRRLLEAGYIERHTDQADRRVRQLVLTASGEAALAALKTSFSGINERVEAVLTDEEIRVIADALGRLIAAFEEK